MNDSYEPNQLELCREMLKSTLERAEKTEADNARLRASLWTVGHEASRLREALEELVTSVALELRHSDDDDDMKHLKRLSNSLANAQQALEGAP